MTATAGTLLVLVLALMFYDQHAWSIERSYVHFLAPGNFDEKTLGANSRRVALLQPDLLIIYGSSELEVGGPYNPATLFRRYPTGLMVFPVYRDGMGTLSIMEEVAATGSELQGRKVVVSVSSGFFLSPMARKEAYAHSFSRLNASALIFSSQLSFTLKKAAAKRMSEYPDTLTSDGVLRWAMEALELDAPFDQLIYYSLYPLGRLDLLILHLQDHQQLLDYISQIKLDPHIAHLTVPLDWSDMLARAASAHSAHATNNPFGINNEKWLESGALWASEKGDLANGAFVRAINGSKEWADLDLLLDELQTLGAQTLLLVVPFHGQWYDYRGSTAQERQIFYDRIRRAAERRHVSIVTFEQFEYDNDFFHDVGGHPSEKGWVYYDRALDEFYHGDRLLADIPPSAVSSSP